MPSSFNVLLQTKAHPKIIMLFGLATKKISSKSITASDGKS